MAIRDPYDTNEHRQFDINKSLLEGSNNTPPNRQIIRNDISLENNPSFYEHIIYWEFGERVNITREDITEAQINVNSLGRNVITSAQRAWDNGQTPEDIVNIFAQETGLQTRDWPDWVWFIIINIIMILLSRK